MIVKYRFPAFLLFIILIPDKLLSFFAKKLRKGNNSERCGATRVKVKRIGMNASPVNPDLRTELKQTTTATATRTSPNKRFNEQNSGSARAF